MTTTTTISTKREGRRTYITGNTYPHREAIRAAGAHWDPDAKAWWIGSDEAATALVAKPASAPAPKQPATFARLDDGSWGLRGPGLVSGAATSVRKRDGTTSTETVGEILSTSPDGYVTARIVASSGKPKTRSNGYSGGRRPGVCSDCGGHCKAPYTLCWDCKTSLDEDMGVYR